MFPAHPLFARFPYRLKFRWPFDGRVLDLEWLEDGGQFFFRPESAPSGFIWHCYEPQKAVSAVDALAYSVKFKTIRRLYVLDEKEWVSLGCNWKQDLVFLEGERLGAGFQLPREQQFTMQKRLFAGADETLTLLQTLRSAPNTEQVSLPERLDSEPDSDLNRAFRWLPNAQNPWALIAISPDKRSELETLLRALITLFGRTNVAIRLSFNFFERAANNSVRIRYVGSNLFVPTEFFDFLNGHFRLKFVDRSRFLAYGGWHAFTNSFPSISFQVSPRVSAHERLEALLIWRDFLENKLSSEEIETLLSTP